MNKSSKTSNRGPAINENISSSKVRVVSEKGEMIGVLSREEALSKAYDQGLDLV